MVWTPQVGTHIWGPLRTCSARCARTGRTGQAAGRRWCSWWSEWHLVAVLCCGWTDPASGSPVSSPDPLLRCQSTSAGPPSLTPDQSSSLSWCMGRVITFSAIIYTRDGLFHQRIGLYTFYIKFCYTWREVNIWTLKKSVEFQTFSLKLNKLFWGSFSSVPRGLSKTSINMSSDSPYDLLLLLMFQAVVFVPNL